MKKFYLVLLFFANICLAQQENIVLKGGFANFDDTDGFEVSISYNKELNRYLDFELNFSYAKSSDFPTNYNFSDYLNQNYWYTKSSIYGITPLLNIVFIRTEKHYFSFYGGAGVMFIDSVDALNARINQENFSYQSDIESQTTISKSIGLKYLYFIKNFGFGLDAKLLSPIKNKDSFFGQDNYRSINLILSKSF